MKMYVDNFFEPVALLNMIQKAQAIRSVFKSHKASYQRNLDDIFAGIDNTIDDLADAWKNGWTKEQVLALPKGSRPNPSVYLKQDYIDNHLAKFNQEGGAFVVVESWIQNGSHSAFPMKKFAMLNSDMQNALLTYRQTGQVSDLETALGYNPGDLMGLEDELFVFYPNSSVFDFQMPNGNEIGANNLWEPGGKTSGNFKEAVLINKNSPTSPITHNKSIEVLKSQFNWEKL